MKRNIIYAILSVLSLCACAQDNPDNSGNLSVRNNEKILIVYFSRAGYNYNGSMPNYVEWTDIGNTARVAGFIQEFTRGDTFEIIPVEAYPDDYNEMLAVSTNERDNNLRPEFIGDIDNIEEYDIIFIGGPVWYGGMPMILHTFYDEYRDRINGKTIVPFDTHGGSGIADYVTMARRYCPDSEILEAFAVTGTNAKNSSDDVKSWLLKIGILSDKDNASVNTIQNNTIGLASYYSITGQSISNPEKGLYIKVQDGQTSKIIL